MSLVVHHRRKLAYELGSKADTRQFIPFSKNTNTDSGRKVFIDAALAPLFAHFFQADDANTIRIVSRIEQLSAVAGGVKANPNANTPFEYMENIGPLAIYYQVHKQAQGNTAKDGVYITGIQKSAKESKHNAGLWEVTPRFTRLVDNDVAEHPTAYVSAAEDPETALEKHKGKDGWGEVNAFNLFFIPTPIQNEMGMWMTPEARAIRPEVTARHLAEVLAKTQKFKGHNQTIKWTLEGDTVKLLQLSLGYLPNLLDRLEFSLINPVADTIGIAKALEYRGAKVIHDIGDNRRAKAAAAVSAARSTNPDEAATKALEAKGVGANRSLVDYNNLRKIKTNFLDYVRNLSGSMAW